MFCVSLLRSRSVTCGGDDIHVLDVSRLSVCVLGMAVV